MRNSKWWQKFHFWQNYPFNRTESEKVNTCALSDETQSAEKICALSHVTQRKKKRKRCFIRQEETSLMTSVSNLPPTTQSKLGDGLKACLCDTLRCVCVWGNVLACDCAWVLTEHFSHCNNKQPLRQGMKEHVCALTSPYRMCRARPRLRGSGCSWHWRLLWMRKRKRRKMTTQRWRCGRRPGWWKARPAVLQTPYLSSTIQSIIRASSRTHTQPATLPFTFHLPWTIFLFNTSQSPSHTHIHTSAPKTNQIHKCISTGPHISVLFGQRVVRLVTLTIHSVSRPPSIGWKRDGHTHTHAQSEQHTDLQDYSQPFLHSVKQAFSHLMCLTGKLCL